MCVLTVRSLEQNLYICKHDVCKCLWFEIASCKISRIDQSHWIILKMFANACDHYKSDLMHLTLVALRCAELAGSTHSKYKQISLCSQTAAEPGISRIRFLDLTQSTTILELRLLTSKVPHCTCDNWPRLSID